MPVRFRFKPFSWSAVVRFPGLLWRWLSSPHHSVTDPGSRRQTQLLMAFTAVISLTTLGGLFVTADWAHLAQSDQILIFLVAISALAYGLARSRIHRLGAMLLCLGISFCGYALILSGSMEPIRALMITVALSLIIGSVLLPVWNMVVLTLGNIAAIWLVALYFHSFELSSAGIATGIFAPMGLLLITSQLYYNAVEQARLADAQVINEELKSFQTVLEQRIAERTQNVEEARREAEEAREEAIKARGVAESQVWLAEGQARLGERLRGEQDLATLAANAIQQLCSYLEAPMGALFVVQDGVFQMAGSFAYPRRKHMFNRFKMGEGMVGQAALEKQVLTLSRVPTDYFSIDSGLVKVTPRILVVAPLMYGGQVVGVAELARMAELTPEQVEFLQRATENIAVAVNTALTRAQINTLLNETRLQAEALREQEEELRASNEELGVQADRLRASESRLREKQGELELANGELGRKAAALEVSSNALQEQKALLDRQNRELERKAEELALASKYKSEFLANMSHELRTPLNSLLILARMLSNNEGGNLTADQIKSAQVIYNSGTDLLNLINEILDLSKVEAGRMDFHFAPMLIADLGPAMHTQFAHVAQEKGLEFLTTVEDGLPAAIETDDQRVKQIVKNLLSNAFKFTSTGSIHLHVGRPQAGVTLNRSGLDPANAIAIQVIDTGIGMRPEQQQVVFEAFRQADGSTSRKYGGTGLGLTISRELALRLGGEIGLQSEFGKGSTFTLYLPTQRPAGAEAPAVAVTEPQRRPESAPAPVAPAAPRREAPVTAADVVPLPGITDDRSNLMKGDKVVLVVEDDLRFAEVVGGFARSKGFKCLIAGDGETGIKLAQIYVPQAIILDLKLPQMSGWEVLDTLKQTPETRHIPVHIISAQDGNPEAGKRGAVGFITKPVTPEELENVFDKIEGLISRKVKSLLLVEDDMMMRQSVKMLLAGNDLEISEAGTGTDALALLAARHFDCMILDLTLPDMSGYELLNRLDSDPAITRCPIIVCTGMALTEAESQELMKHADSIVIKGIKSPERLLDETALFLHRVVAEMPEEKQEALKNQLHAREAQLEGKRVMVVDDDMRNAFALSKLLGGKGVEVTIAQSGVKALELLESNAGIDLILMDIMMPEMDGYETTRRIRAMPKFRNLPILALTAKAMKGDADKCIAAGASDYLSKPVDVDRLFSMLRVWLYK